MAERIRADPHVGVRRRDRHGVDALDGGVVLDLAAALVVVLEPVAEGAAGVARIGVDHVAQAGVLRRGELFWGDFGIVDGEDRQSGIHSASLPGEAAGSVRLAG